MNIVFLRTKYNLSRLLYYFENNIFKLGMISGKELFTFVFQIIIKVVPQIIILILYTIGNIAFIKEIRIYLKTSDLSLYNIIADLNIYYLFLKS